MIGSDALEKRNATLASGPWRNFGGSRNSARLTLGYAAFRKGVTWASRWISSAASRR